MRQTTLDTFYKAKSSSKCLNRIDKKELYSSTPSNAQRLTDRKPMPQKQQKNTKSTSLTLSKKRKLTQNENSSRKKSPLFSQKETESPVNANECLLAPDEGAPIPNAKLTETWHTEEDTPNSSQKSDENIDSNLSNINQQFSLQSSVTLKNPTTDSTPQKKSGFSPKTPTSNKTASPKKRPHRKLYSNLIETSLLSEAVAQMNLAKEGAISANNFDLEEIYTTNTFTFTFNQIDTSTAIRYDEENIVMPLEHHSEHMFTTITTVFSNPVNCGYFSESELDFVFSILTLSKRAQMLFIRMLKRKHAWHRVNLLNYPELTDNLKPIFEELITKSFCDSDIENDNMLTMLGLLQVDELTKICRKLKVNPTGSKDTKIENMLKSHKTEKPLFPGMKSPMCALTSLVKSQLGFCVRMSARVVWIFEKIITLLLPNRDPEHTLSDIFFMFRNVENGEVVFPKVAVHHFPIFADTAQLEGYAEAKAIYTKVLNGIKNKKWEQVRSHGEECLTRATDLMEMEAERLEMSALPIHVKRYKPLYVWLKILSKTIDAFKKTPKTMHKAVQILKFLLSQNCFLRHYRARWYSELALIEMHHHKDLETSASTTLSALTEDNLTVVDVTDLLARAQMLVKRKTGICDDTKNKVREILEQATLRVPKLNATTVTIQATSFRRHEQGLKATWLIEMPNDEDSRLGTVEQLALQHYCDQGFSQGAHCESKLPLSLFYTLLWEELYDVDVPGAWVTNYQWLPCDLTTETFYKFRKNQIDKKFEDVNNLDAEAFSDMLQARFNNIIKYSHITENNPFNKGSHFKEIINCLGVKSVIGICKKLVTNYSIWKAGFPDLIVWNSTTNKCKIVEVKGPTDKLSTKQKLWLQYLMDLNVDAEVCLVQGDARYKPKLGNKGREDIPDM